MFGCKGTNKIWNINYFLFFFYQLSLLEKPRLFMMPKEILP